MKTLQELDEKYGEDRQGMLNHMMKAVRMYGENLKPEEYFTMFEAHVIALLTYMIRLITAGGKDDELQEQVVKEFLDYAMFDKMARMYSIIERKSGKKLIVP
jgi:membrane protein insertase Oxa1/YidC/SpoIIIJ